MNCYWCGSPFMQDEQGNPEFQIVTDADGHNRKVDADCAELGEFYARTMYVEWCEANGVALEA